VPSGLLPSWPPGPAAKNAFNSSVWSLVSVPSLTCWSIRLSTRAFICLGSSVPPVWLLSPDCSELSILSSAVSIALASVWLSTPALTAAVMSSSIRLRGDGRWVMEPVDRAEIVDIGSVPYGYPAGLHAVCSYRLAARLAPGCLCPGRRCKPLLHDLCALFQAPFHLLGQFQPALLGGFPFAARLGDGLAQCGEPPGSRV
jgi:hypothetical protein